MATSRDAAARSGEVYYDGKPCKKCGGTKRYTSTAGCVACLIKRGKAERRRIKKLIAEARGIKAAAVEVE